MGGHGVSALVDDANLLRMVMSALVDEESISCRIGSMIPLMNMNDILQA